MAGTSNPLVRKLSAFVDLSPAETDILQAWCAKPVACDARSTFIRMGDQPNNLCVLLDGWGYRYIDTKHGRRQIVGFLLPGDFGDALAFLLKSADHSLGFLGSAIIASVPERVYLETISGYPRLAAALSWSALVDAGIARNWIANIGQQDAAVRTAHLFCELWCRGQAVGLIDDARLAVPMTQQDLGDALGLTSVHINRTLKLLRERGLALFRNKELLIDDFDSLVRFAGYNGSYLQLKRRAG